MKKDILKDLLAKPGKKQLVSDFDSSFTGDLSKQDAKENWQRILRSFRSCKVCFMRKTGIQS